MSSVQTALENPTELRLDYKDIVAGRVVLVIHGLPTAHQVELAPDIRGAVTASANASSRAADPATPSSPLGDEAAVVSEALGDVPVLFMPLLLAAWRGREVLASELAAATIEEAPPGGAEDATALTDYATAVLCNGLGRYQEALVAARRACTCTRPGLTGRIALELVEAGARSRDLAVAADALRRLEEATRTGTDWAIGAWARSAALVGEGAAAEALYREAIDRFDGHGDTIHLARARLVYGEWLRRENRRVDAREQLRAARELLGGSGAEAFADRARRELLATGETARRRTEETRDLLTPQEAQVARLARDGFSNPEIGAQLYISHRTVQYHLRKVFAKLGITSRNQLARVPASSLQSA